MTAPHAYLLVRVTGVQDDRGDLDMAVLVVPIAQASDVARRVVLAVDAASAIMGKPAGVTCQHPAGWVVDPHDLVSIPAGVVTDVVDNDAAVRVTVWPFGEDVETPEVVDLYWDCEIVGYPRADGRVDVRWEIRDRAHAEHMTPWIPSRLLTDPSKP